MFVAAVKKQFMEGLTMKLLEEKNSITVAEVKDLLNTSESTVRRDITALHNAGKLVLSLIHI